MPVNTLLKGYLKGFSGFTEEESLLIDQESYFTEMKKNEKMLGCGDVCTNVYFLIKGKIRVYKILPDGKEITLYRVMDGEMCLFSIGHILDHDAFDAIATIEVDSEFLVMPQDTFMELMGKNESFRNYILKRLISSLSEVMLLVEELTFKNMNKRIAKFLLEQIQNPNNEMVAKTIKMTHEMIAYELGTAREVVSRLLKEFESLGIVKLSRGKIMIKQLQDLKNILIM